MLWAAGAETLLGDFALCRGLDVRAACSGLRVPEPVCVAGADDLLVPPAQVAATAALLPAAEVLVVERSAHLSHPEQPAVVYERLDEFLRKIRS